MAKSGGLQKQPLLTSALIQTAPSANRVAAGIARSGARAELMVKAGGFLSNEHGPGRARNVLAIEGSYSPTSGTRGPRA